MGTKMIGMLIVGLLIANTLSVIGASPIRTDICEPRLQFEWKWARDGGGISIDYGYDIDFDKSGNSYVVGKFHAAAVFGSTSLMSHGGWDVFVTKMNSYGHWVWAVGAGGIDQDEGLGIAVDAEGNSFITGVYYTTAHFGNITLTALGGGPDVFIAKLDTNGTWQWVISAGGYYGDTGYGIDIDGNGSIYVTGVFRGDATFGDTTLSSPGNNDVFIAKLDTNGAWDWAVSGGGSADDDVWDIAADGSGNSYVIGGYNGSATFGETTLACLGYSDVFIAKLDVTGAWQWARCAGGSSNEIGSDIDVDNNGIITVTGNFMASASFGATTLSSQGYNDVFVASLTAAGDWQWVVSAGGIWNDFGMNLAIDPEGVIYITGYFEDSATFGTTTLVSQGIYDIFVASVNMRGDWQWAINAGGASWDAGYALCVDPDGNIYVTGIFEGTANFGKTSLTSNGDFDVFIAKLALEEPNVPPVADFSITPEAPVAGQTIMFNASTSYDTDGQIVSYAWDFGDHATGSGMVIDHVYSEVGVYDVTLTVIDEDAASDRFTSQIEVSAAQPPIAFTIRGGFGVKAVLTNSGTSDALGVPWSIRVDGGILSLLHKTNEGMTNVTAGATATVGTGIFLGFGPITITARVGSEEHTATGTQFLIYSFVK